MTASPAPGPPRPGPPPGPGQPGPGQPGDDLEELDPGLARERTSLAWLRTALSFAALGGVVLKVNLPTGLLIFAVAPVVWQLGRISQGSGPGSGLSPASPARLFFIALSVVAVALLSLMIAIFGQSVPGALR
jgi:uncharacterized membrane protein YidH (DUF202 family)